MADGSRDGIVLFQLQGWVLREILWAVRPSGHHPQHKHFQGRTDGNNCRPRTRVATKEENIKCILSYYHNCILLELHKFRKVEIHIIRILESVATGARGHTPQKM